MIHRSTIQRYAQPAKVRFAPIDFDRLFVEYAQLSAWNGAF
jgi:hypothetical protein